MEEGLFFDRVALHYTGVAPGNVQGSAAVVANLADTRLALRDGAAVTTGETAYAIPVEFLVEFAFADVLVNDIPQRRHTPQPSQAISRPHFTQKCNGEASRARTRIGLRRDRHPIALHQLRIGNTPETDQPPVSLSCYFAPKKERPAFPPRDTLVLRDDKGNPVWSWQRKN